MKKPVYKNLWKLVKNKDYFVLTTNVDHCFQKNGFEKSRLFYTQGDYGLWQCSTPCHPNTYENEEQVRKMVKEQKNRKIPTALIPRCPICHKPMTMNLRVDSTFVEDNGWKRAAEQYERFIHQHKKGRMLFLELGVGYNTPGIIKYPFWQMTMQNPKAVYACLNLDDAAASREIIEKSICIREDIGEVMQYIIFDNSYAFSLLSTHSN